MGSPPLRSLEECGELLEQAVRQRGVVYTDVTMAVYNPAVIPFVARAPTAAARSRRDFAGIERDT